MTSLCLGLKQPLFWARTLLHIGYILQSEVVVSRQQTFEIESSIARQAGGRPVFQVVDTRWEEIPE